MQITAHKVTAYRDSHGSTHGTRQEAEDAEFRIALGRIIERADLLSSHQHAVFNFISENRVTLRALLNDKCTVVEAQ